MKIKIKIIFFILTVLDDCDCECAIIYIMLRYILSNLFYRSANLLKSSTQRDQSPSPHLKQ